MKGTDVTDAQLAHAQEFLRSAAGGKFDPEFMESQKYVTVDKEDIIRLLAWYGAIRAKGGRETPAPLVHRTGPGSTMDFGTPEQLAEMPTPQPVGKIMLAAKDLSPEALESGATAELVREFRGDERPTGSTGYPDYEATDPACSGVEAESVAVGQAERAALHIHPDDTTDEPGVGDDRERRPCGGGHPEQPEDTQCLNQPRTCANSCAPFRPR